MRVGAETGPIHSGKIKPVASLNLSLDTTNHWAPIWTPEPSLCIWGPRVVVFLDARRSQHRAICGVYTTGSERSGTEAAHRPSMVMNFSQAPYRKGRKRDQDLLELRIGGNRTLSELYVIIR
jgi:hypothetical protein